MKISDEDMAAIASMVYYTIRRVVKELAEKEPQQMDIPEFLKKKPLDKPTPAKEKEKETVPEAGVRSFIVTNKQSHRYTIIGADNIHHAQMKATKLFGQTWYSIETNDRETASSLLNNGYRFLPVKKFNQLIALLQSP